MAYGLIWEVQGRFGLMQGRFRVDVDYGPRIWVLARFFLLWVGSDIVSNR